METAWYFRLFYVPILTFAISLLLYGIIRAKRMGSPQGGKSWMIGSMVSLIIFIVLLWFVPFRFNLAFWIGLCIVVLGQVVFALGYSAMREHPEKKQTVVDWGIYGVSRHSHVLAGIITNLGVIIMGWNTASLVYVLVWVYFVLDVIFSHLYVVMEDRVNVEKFGQEYVDYMKRVPRYLFVK